MAKTLEKMARQKRLEYFRQWRAANKDKARKHNENYWKKQAEMKMREGGANG